MATQPDNHLAVIVGKNIARARAKHGLTQQELAARLGTSISRVSGWENGRSIPSGRHHQGLANEFFDGDTSALYRELKEAA